MRKKKGEVIRTQDTKYGKVEWVRLTKEELLNADGVIILPEIELVIRPGSKGTKKPSLRKMPRKKK